MKYHYLSILLLCIVFNVSSQNSFEYIVEEIPYQTFQEQGVVQFNADDIYSGIITMPFLFDFYNLGANDQFVVGSNGTVTFDVTEANNSMSWQFAPTDLIPSTILPFPAILGPYHDIDNGVANNGGVYTGITGIAPNRSFHVTFEQIPQYLNMCNNLLSTFQIILHETSGIIDVVITEKPACPAWNNGLAVLGLQAEVGSELHGISAPGRNTGVWSAQNEAWRFTPTSFLNGFNVVICDADNDATELFNMDAYKTTLFQMFNLEEATNTVAIYDFNDALVSGDVNVTLGNGLPENAYTIEFNGGVQQFDLSISLVDCSADNDTDGLTNEEEDVNGNGNLNDDDTDGDGIPNYLDDDDDGDTVLTNIEVVFGRPSGESRVSATFLDTDSDNIPDHLDFDDDGDGVLTLDEDYNGNGDPTDDDLNNNGIADYLDNQILNVNEVGVDTTLFSVFPNPASDVLYIEFSGDAFWGDSVKTKVYDYQGRLILESTQSIFNNQVKLDVSSLASGNYILTVKKDNFINAKKFVVD